MEPEGGYGVKDTTITIPEIGGVPAHDTVVTIVTPNPEFTVFFPGFGAPPATGQIITFNVNLPGVIQQTRDTVDAAGVVSPGVWIVGDRPVQRVIATPVAGDPGFLDVSTVPPPPPEPEE